MAKKTKSFSWDAPIEGRDDSWVSPIERAAIRAREEDRARREEEARLEAERLSNRRADFSNVESEVTLPDAQETTAPRLDAWGGFGDRATALSRAALDSRNVTAARGWLEGAGAGAAFRASRELRDEQTSPLDIALGSVAQLLPGGTLATLSGQDPRTTVGVAAEDTYRDLRQRQRASQKTVQTSLDAMPSGVQKEFAEAVSDVAGSPTSLLSIWGGPLASVGALDVYNQEWMAAKEAGLSDADAEAQAAPKASAELIGMIPAGKVLSKIKPLEGTIARLSRGKLVDSVASVAAGRTVKTSLGEAVEELATTYSQMGVDAVLASQSNSPEARKYAQDNLPKDTAEFFDATWRTLKAGALGGAAIGGPVDVMRTMKEAGEQAALLRQHGVDQETKRLGFQEQADAVRKAREEQEQKALAEGAAADFITSPTGATPAPPIRTPAGPKAKPGSKADLAWAGLDQVNKEIEDSGVDYNTLDPEDARVAPREIDPGIMNPNITPSTTTEIMDHFARNIGQADSRRVAELVRAGNVEFIDGKEGYYRPQVITDTMMGWYDPLTSKVYINSKMVDKNNINGSVMSVLAHEIKHGADLAGSKALREGRMKNLIGDEANKLIVNKIRAMKDSHPAMFNWVMRGTKASIGNRTGANAAEAAMLEAPAYFINWARENPGQANDRGVKSVLNNLKNAMTRGVKEKLGVTLNLDMNDMAYLSDQLIREVAAEGSRLKDAKYGNMSPPAQEGGDVSPMIISGGTGAAKALYEGRSWLSADGKRKYEIDDSGSRAKIPDEASQGKIYKARDVLQHDELFRELPEIGDIPVEFEFDQTSSYGGKYEDPTDEFPQGKITVNLADNRKGEDRNKFNSLPHRNLVHELQHAAQQIAGSTGGSSPENFLSPEGKKLRRNIKDTEQAIEGAKALGADPFDYADQQTALSDLRNKFSSEWQEAVKRYKRVGGEQEAFSTVDRMDLTMDERMDDTILRGKTLEQQFIERDGGFYSRSGKRLDAPMVNAMAASSTEANENLGKWADELFGDMEAPNGNKAVDNFKEWFKGSKVINKDGTPKIMYHGTTAEEDFTIFSPSEFEIGTHVGTKAQANDPAFVGDQRDPANIEDPESRANKAAQKDKSRIIPVFVNIKNPLRMPDDFGRGINRIATNIADMLEAMRADSAIVDEVLDIARQKYYIEEADKRAAWADLIELLRRAGYDGFVYTNMMEGVKNERTTDPTSRRYNPYAEDTVNDSYVVFSPRQLKSLYGNEGNFSSTSGDITAMNVVPQPVRESMQRRDSVLGNALRIFKNQLTTYGTVGKAFAVKLEESVGYAALRANRASHAYHRLDRGRRIMAKDLVRSGKAANREQALEMVNNKINTLLSQLGATPDVNRRRSMLASFARANPELDALVTGFDEIDQLTRILVHEMAKTKNPPTDDDRKLFDTMLKNQAQYLTRLFSAFEQQQGRKWVNQLVEHYEKGRAAKAKSGNVPPKFKDMFDRYQGALNFFITNDIDLSQPQLEQLSDAKLRRVFDLWADKSYAEARQEIIDAGRAQGVKAKDMKDYLRNEMIRYVVDKTTNSRDQIETKAHELVEAALNLTDSNKEMAKYYRGLKLDKDILKRRTNVPDALRKLYGEIEDPIARLAVTIGKQGELAARYKLLNDVRTQFENKLVIQEAKTEADRKKYSVVLTGEGYGPLEGWRATPDLANKIQDNLQIFSSLGEALVQNNADTSAYLTALGSSVARRVSGFAKVSKMASVVFDPFAMVMNFVGSPALLGINGTISPKNIVRGAQAATGAIMDVAFPGGKLTNNPDLEDGVRYGAIDNARVQEIRKLPSKVLKEIINGKPGTPHKAMLLAKRAGATWVEAYAMADAWVKLSTFFDRTDTLREYYKALGQDMSEDAIKKQAANEIKDTNITYGRVPDLFRKLEAPGFTTFGVYFASVPRVIAHGYKQATVDMMTGIKAAADGKEKAGAIMFYSGAKRLAGTTAATAGMVALTKAAAAAFSTDDEEDEEEIKKAMLDDARFADEVYVGKDDEGKHMFIRLSRADALGPVNDLLRVWNSDLSPEDKRRAVAKTITGLFFNNRGAASMLRAGWEAMTPEDTFNDKKTKVERLAPGMTAAYKNAVDNLPLLDYTDGDATLTLLDSVIPGWVDALDPKNKIPEFSGKNQEQQDWARFAVGLGGRLDVADPGLTAAIKGKAVKEVRDDARRQIADKMKAGASAQDLIDEAMSHVNDEYTALGDMRDLVDGMRAMKMSNRQIMAVLKESGKLTEVDAGMLVKGRLDPELMDLDTWATKHSSLLSKSSMEQRTKEQGKDQDTEDKKKMKEMIRELKRLGFKVRD